MPTYEYRCENGHTFEAIQRFSDDPLTACEVCSAPVQRVMYAPAVHFKGSGFYNTDYGTKKRQRELKEAGDGGSSKDGGGDTAASESGEKKSDGGEKKTTESTTAKSDSKPAPAKKAD